MACFDLLDLDDGYMIKKIIKNYMHSDDSFHALQSSGSYFRTTHIYVYIDGRTDGLIATAAHYRDQEKRSLLLTEAATLLKNRYKCIFFIIQIQKHMFS